MDIAVFFAINIDVLIINNNTVLCRCRWVSLSIFRSSACTLLTHWGRMTHICVGKLTNIGLDNGLSPGRRQAIIWTNARILLIGPLGRNFSEFLIVNHTCSFNEMHLKMSSAKWRPFSLGLNMLSLFREDGLQIPMPYSLSVLLNRNSDAELWCFLSSE